MPITNHSPGLLATVVLAEMLNNPLTSQYIPMKLKNDLAALSGTKSKDIPNARAMMPRTSVIHQYLTANERRSAFVLDCDIYPLIISRLNSPDIIIYEVLIAYHLPWNETAKRRQTRVPSNRIVSID
jgi:hypothetical protein